MRELYPIDFERGSMDRVVEIANAIGARVTRVPVLCPHGELFLVSEEKCSACKGIIWWTETATWFRPYGKVAVSGMDDDTYEVAYISGRYAGRLYRWLLAPDARRLISADAAYSIISDMVEREVLVLSEEQLDEVWSILESQEEDSVAGRGSVQDGIRKGIGTLGPEETDAVFKQLAEEARQLLARRHSLQEGEGGTR